MKASSAQINYIRHLNAFFAQARKDDRLHAHHMSLYMALFQVWNQYRFQNPFPVLREEVMSLSRIGSRSTYVGCLKHLHACQYIVYQPAKHPYAPSLITILSLTDFVADPTREQLLLFSSAMWPKSKPRNEYETGPHMRPETGPRSGPKVGHFYNKHINNLKQEGENTLPPTKKIKKNEVKKDQLDTGAPGAENAPGTARILPALSETQEFFNAHVYPKVEADKFFHHYQANGWRQGGKTLITDWQAAAHKWVLNIHPQKPESNDRHTKPATGAGRLHINENKSYSDPL
ncbi:hypothetical protein ACTJJ0_03330 [Chitinophaga sp. 22321]|uniref:Transcriptional regulator n=1 Tax=Chitinophaga hostae TaxID=2831022 RepID=A0ABS5IXI5_9BACT|nr:hypothetical protein [Chitinophaga hostae]MBS0027674.1 hypothetical protein [Chitinophaga hostae]